MTKTPVKLLFFLLTSLITLWSVFMIIAALYAVIFKDIGERSKSEIMLMSVFPILVFFIFGIISVSLFNKIKDSKKN